MSLGQTTVSQTYTLAHTAQCKLRLAANRPDRNLRFLLGHSFTFDNLMLKIVEIESDSSDSDPEPEPTPASAERRVSFQDNSNRPTGELRSGDLPHVDPTKKLGRASSPPPPEAAARLDDDNDDDDDDDDIEDYDDDDGDGGLGLTRFTSASAQPPRMIPDTAENQIPEPELKSPPSQPSDAMLATITEEEGDEMLAGLYNSVAGCGCQKQADVKAPVVEKAWEIPGQHGTGRRTAVVSLRA